MTDAQSLVNRTAFRRSPGFVQGLLALAVAAFWAASPAGAQDLMRGQLAVPNVVCRAAPAHDADMLGVFRRLGDIVPMRIGATAVDTSATGEVWIQVPPVYSQRAGVDGYCWMPQAVLDVHVDDDSQGASLLRIADRILHASQTPGLDGVVDAYNLFEQRWAREAVANSPILGLRRLELIERALAEAALDGFGWAYRDPTEDKPVLRAWIESLGPDLRYGTGPVGPRRWGLGPAAFEALLATRDGHPDLDDPLRQRISRLAEAAAQRPEVGEPNGPSHTEGELLAMVDALTTTDDRASPTELLRVYNLLWSRAEGNRELVESSPELGLQRLDVLRRWVEPIDRWSVEPLALALIRSLEPEIRYFEPGGMWILSNQAYLDLYERHRGRPEAEEILWRWASSPAAHDCEGSFACGLGVIVLDRRARYWNDYPQGSHVVEALADGRRLVELHLSECEAALAGEPGSLGARWKESVWSVDGVEAALVLRESLSEVDAEAKAPLVETLDALEACAAASG